MRSATLHMRCIYVALPCALLFVLSGCVMFLKAGSTDKVQITVGTPARPSAAPQACDPTFRAERMEVPAKPTFTGNESADEMLVTMAAYVKSLYLFREHELDDIDMQYARALSQCAQVGNASLAPSDRPQ